jgi:hypothetical protein
MSASSNSNSNSNSSNNSNQSSVPVRGRNELPSEYPRSLGPRPPSPVRNMNGNAIVGSTPANAVAANTSIHRHGGEGKQTNANKAYSRMIGSASQLSNLNISQTAGTTFDSL